MAVLDNLCRLCLQSVTEGVDLFSVVGNVNEESYSQKLMSIFRIRLDEAIQNPTLGCADCIRWLDDIKSFREKILQTQQQLSGTIPIAKVECVEEGDFDPLDESSLPTDDEIDSKDIPQLPLAVEMKVKKEKVGELPKGTNPKASKIESDQKPKQKTTQKKRLDSGDVKVKVKKEVVKKSPVAKVRAPNQKSSDSTFKLTAEEKSSLQEMIHQLNLYKCSECEREQFNTFFELKRHMMDTHKLVKGFVLCCNRKFINNKRVLEHMKYHQDKDAFKCDECGHTFMYSGAMRIHKQLMHLSPEEVNFACDVCGRGFKLETLYNEHVKTHLPKEQREFECDLCQKRFSTAIHLKQHRSFHNKALSHICEICGKAYATTSFLNQHIKTHEEKTMEQCKECGKFFYDVRKHALNVHAAKRENCPMCGKNLHKRYMSSHMKYFHPKDGNSFKECSVCGKEIKLACFREHMNLHSGVRKNCHFCPATATSSANLSKHMREKHPQQYAEYRAKKNTERQTKNAS